jgi:hypothetical protein
MESIKLQNDKIEQKKTCLAFKPNRFKLKNVFIIYSIFMSDAPLSFLSIILGFPLQSMLLAP